jgi:hypothetical protein
MGSAILSIDYECQAKPFTADGAIAQYTPVYLTGKQKVAQVTAVTQQPIGVALEAVADGAEVSVALVGSVVPLIMDAAYAVGSRVAFSTGNKCKGVGVTTPAGTHILGWLLEASTADGHKCGVLINPHAPASLGPFRSFIADGAITATNIVKIGSADDKVTVAGATVKTGIVGVALTSAADGAACLVALAGSVAQVTAGGNITRGNDITSTTAGAAIASAPASGVNSMCVGTAMESVSSSATFFLVVQPFIKQGE